jgi:hypothetical protein
MMKRKTLDQKSVNEIAASILEKGQQTTILVRAEGAGFMLVEGLHRLVAAKALGEKAVLGDTSAASPAGYEKSREGRSTGSSNTRVAAFPSFFARAKAGRSVWSR